MRREAAGPVRAWGRPLWGGFELPGREIRLGIARKTHVDKPFSVWHINPRVLDQADFARQLRSMNAAGFIAQVNTPSLARKVRRLRIPVINVSEKLPRPPCFSVLPDQRAAGAMAATHMIELGLRNLAYVGQPGYGFAIARGEGFTEAAGQQGMVPEVFAPEAKDDSGQWWPSFFERLGDWLTSLPKPVGVLGADDPLAKSIVAAATQRGLCVPQEVAVIGINNDELHCELAEPPLTSVEMGAERIGYEAARYMADILTGSSVPPEPVRLAPIGVVTRATTDILAISDQQVASAVRYIRRHAHQPIGVEQVMEQVAVSRRTLEMRFRKSIGRTPFAEIQRAHIERAKELLVQTELPVTRIATAAGFNELKQLTVTFKRHVGVAPTAYRARFRVE